MDFAPYAGAIEKVSDLVSGVLKRVLPEKMSEKDAADLNQQITLELLKQDWASVEKEYQDRADARALAKADGEDGNWFTKILSATVRPAFGYACMTAFLLPLGLRIGAVATGHAMPEIELNMIEKEIVLQVIMFYFGGRTAEKLMASWQGKKK